MGNPTLTLLDLSGPFSPFFFFAPRGCGDGPFYTIDRFITLNTMMEVCDCVCVELRFVCHVYVLFPPFYIFFLVEGDYSWTWIPRTSIGFSSCLLWTWVYSTYVCICVFATVLVTW
jgi:hypothetical protein